MSGLHRQAAHTLGDNIGDLQGLEAILEAATRISAKASAGAGVLIPRGEPYLPSATVKFPGERVVAFDRVGMWVDGPHVRLAMWPAELKAQYTRVYSDPAKVEALIDLGTHAGWTLEPNFQLAHRFAQPLQRWYPGRHLPSRCTCSSGSTISVRGALELDPATR
jgi:O-acetyl-ADP-ribose deacetylase